MTDPIKVDAYVGLWVNHDGAVDLPDELVMMRVMLSGVPIAELVVEYGYRLVVGADGVRAEKLWEVPPEGVHP